MATRIKILLLLLLLLNPATAKFICGEVNTTGITTPSWYETTVSLVSNEDYQSTCQVSPSNNRYCCDLEIIKDQKGYQWKILDTFQTKITDNESGYFATSKNLTLTSQGYDVAPNLILEKAIQITSPNSTLTITKTPPQIQANISTNCEQQNQSYQNLTWGKNEISITTTCNNIPFQETKTYFIVENLTFQKTYSKEFKTNSLGIRIKSEEEGNIGILLNLSNEIENIELKEYVPSSWQISNISQNGTLEFSTTDYNVIKWKLTGDTFNLSYNTKAPKTTYFPEDFYFKTVLDETELEETLIRVRKTFFIPIRTRETSSSGGSGGSYTYTPSSLSKVSSEFPLYEETENITAGLYSTSPLQQENFNLLEFITKEKFSRRFTYLTSYKVQTTLNETEKGKMLLEYKTNKTFLEQNNIKEIVFLERQDKKLTRMTGLTIEKTDKELIKYTLESTNPPNEIFILGEKNTLTLLDKILIFFERFYI